MLVYTFTLVAFWLLSLQTLVISVYFQSFLQLVGIESGTSQLVWFIKLLIRLSILSRNSWTFIQTFLCLCNIIANTSTGVQNEIFIEIPILKLLVSNFIDTHGIHTSNVKPMMIIYLFHVKSKICSITMFIVNSLHVSWNLHATSTLCQSTLSNLWHFNSYDFWICKG